MFDAAQNAKDFEYLLMTRAKQIRKLSQLNSSDSTGVLTLEPMKDMYWVSEKELINVASHKLSGDLFMEHIVDFILPSLIPEEIAVAYVNRFTRHIAVLSGDDKVIFHAIGIQNEFLKPLVVNKRYWNDRFDENETIMPQLRDA